MNKNNAGQKQAEKITFYRIIFLKDSVKFPDTYFRKALNMIHYFVEIKALKYSKRKSRKM